MAIQRVSPPRNRSLSRRACGGRRDRSALPAPPFSQARPGHSRSWLRPGGWRSSGRRGDGSDRGSRLRVARSLRGPGSIGQASAASRHRVADSTLQGDPPEKGRWGRSWIGCESPWSPQAYGVTDGAEAILSRPKSNRHFSGIHRLALRMPPSERREEPGDILLCQKNVPVSRGDKTPLELFIAGIWGWEPGLRRRMDGGTSSPD